jgi:hypothetical protein
VSKKGRHKQDLVALFDRRIADNDSEGLMEYLVSNSNLPGRRANLELAAAFAAVVEDYSTVESTRLWQLCQEKIAAHHEIVRALAEAPQGDSADDK